MKILLMEFKLMKNMSLGQAQLFLDAPRKY